MAGLPANPARDMFTPTNGMAAVSMAISIVDSWPVPIKHILATEHRNADNNLSFNVGQDVPVLSGSDHFWG